MAADKKIIVRYDPSDDTALVVFPRREDKGRQAVRIGDLTVDYDGAARDSVLSMQLRDVSKGDWTQSLKSVKGLLETQQAILDSVGNVTSRYGVHVEGAAGVNWGGGYSGKRFS